MFKTILVGVDGSTYSEEALETAIEMAKPFGSKLIIASVYSTPYYFGLIQKYDPVLPPDIKENLDSMLSRYEVKAIEEGVKEVETKSFSVISNLMSVGAVLVIEAEKIGCSMIVIGTRGVTGIKRTLLGSVADYVVRNAHCDVHVVRHRLD
ncbi:MAG: universal stress protein [Candidatus Methanomethylicus sp.]|nr:universal stress protein [Candidatus Methanomethylicus sp.]